MRQGLGGSVLQNGDECVRVCTESRVHNLVIDCRYNGNYLNNLRHGEGSYRHMCGDWFEGVYVRGLREGRGSIFWANGACVCAPYVEFNTV